MKFSPDGQFILLGTTENIIVLIDSFEGKLKHNFKYLEFWDLTIFKSLPIIIQLSPRKVLHHNNKPLLLCLGHGVYQLYNVFVLQVSKSFYFLFDHAICLVFVLKIEVFHCNLLTSQLIKTQVHFPKASLPQMFLELQSVDPDLVVEVFAL